MNEAMNSNTDKKSRKSNILFGILMGGGFICIAVFAFSLILATFYYDKDTVAYFADKKLAIMSINGDIVLGEIGPGPEINTILSAVEGYKHGKDVSYVKGETEFAIIVEKDASWIIKSMSEANEEERKELANLTILD
ncbi:hypothetical protein [Sporosarcina sp. G11-34]|uniref:hypothetical protein n=1 Tax=Sporosarcina sp. G11-34 TaxID=2849605 RepID=UPI0022A96EE3|nr:hypothetical protein [Sporosarcina sp. G11-34]MCZ2257720.1 hypothetical protein [Sporosarcina sp. G11-34]